MAIILINSRLHACVARVIVVGLSVLCVRSFLMKRKELAVYLNLVPILGTARPGET